VTPTEQYVVGVLTEEAAEVQELIGKALRFGLDSTGKRRVGARVQNDVTRNALAIEVGDLLAAIDFALMHSLISSDTAGQARAAKLSKLLDPNATDDMGRRLAPPPKGLR
jgi:hypothetical protein